MHGAHSPQKTYLLDGPMMFIPERKAARTQEMAAHLLKEGRAYLDRGDTVRFLRSLNYDVLDVMLCVDDARHLALVEVVAKEMSEP